MNVRKMIGASAWVDRSYEAGFHHHLGKPPDLAKLAEILASVSLRQAPIR